VPTIGVRKNARHAKPSKAAPTIAAAGLTASFAAVDIAAMAASASAASANDFAALRQCESGNNYRINTGNGYYGAYQFAQGTWSGLGYSGRPHLASPSTQDAAAAKLQARSGWGQWPACSRKLGLGSSSGGSSVSSTSSTISARTEVRASRTRTRSAAPAVVKPQVRVAVAPTTPPVFIGKPLTVADADRFRIGVRMWQGRMADRGWKIDVDGYFGPQSARVAKKFAAQRDLAQTGLSGEVNKVVWDAAWLLPVT